MTNLKLVPDEPTPLERMLLDASRSEQPSDEHKARLRAALGIGLPLSGPLAAPPPPANVAASASGGFTKSVPFAKIALGVGAIGVAAALWFTQAPSAEAPVIIKPVVPVKVVAAEAPVVAPVAEAPAPAVSPLPPVERPVSAPRPRPEPSVASTDDLSEQIRLIEAARAGVAARDSKSALAALGEYSSKFPRGSFGQEATVLRIRAIDQSGDSARATALAKSFIARFPGSPHVARLKPIAERGTSR